MTDFSKISKAVLSAIERLGGENKQIDTREELKNLGDWLNGNKGNMGKAEIEYVEGLMVERSSDIAVKEFKENGTKAAAKEIAEILKSPGPDKKTLDSPVEAQNLAILLKNPPADFNKADLDYIMYLLRSSGYEYLIPTEGVGNAGTTSGGEAVQEDNTKAHPKENSETPPVISPEEEVSVPDTEPSKPAPKKEVLPEKPKNDTEPSKPAPKENIPPEKPKNDIESLKPAPKKEVPPEKPQKAAEPAQQAVITEAGRAEGAALASQLLTEFNQTVIDNDDVKKILAKVNPENAYNFLIGVVKGLNMGINTAVHKNIIDIFNKLTYKDTLHVMQALEQQAINMGLGDNDAVKALSVENKRIAALVAENPKTDPSSGNAQYSDELIQAVLDEMSKIVDEKTPEKDSSIPPAKGDGAVVKGGIIGAVADLLDEALVQQQKK